MKCAMDLITIAVVRAEEIAREEEIRIAREKARQEEIAREEAARKEREAAETRKRTISYCEELGAVLEEKANKGEKPTMTFYYDRYGERLLDSTRDQYVDGRLSYFPCFEKIDLELMAEWFAPYCFNVKIEDFLYWRYLRGQVHGYCVTIEPQPECIK